MLCYIDLDQFKNVNDVVAFYKQALRYGLFDRMKVATTLAFVSVAGFMGWSIVRRRARDGVP